MINQQLLDYIKKCLAEGQTKEKIVASLVANNWQLSDINQTFLFLQNPVDNQIPTPNPTVPTPPITSSTTSPSITVLPSAVEILKKSWSIYKQRIGTFLGIVFIPILISNLLSYFFNFNDKEVIAKKLSVLAEDPSQLLATGLLLIVAVLIIFLINFAWSQAALISAIKSNEEKIGIAESYKLGWQKIGSFLKITVLLVLIYFGGFLLFIVPGLICVVWFNFVYFVLVNEDEKGMKALLKSKEYVKGYFGNVLGKMIFISLVAFLISFIVNFIFGLINLLINQPIVSKVGGFVSSLFVLPLGTIFWYTIYSQLRQLKGEISINSIKKGNIIGATILGIILFVVIIFSGLLNKTTKLDSYKNEMNDSFRQQDINIIKIQLLYFFGDNFRYPTTLDELVPKYLSEIPVDPVTKEPYKYKVLREGKDFEICGDYDSSEFENCQSSNTNIP